MENSMFNRKIEEVQLENKWKEYIAADENKYILSYMESDKREKYKGKYQRLIDECIDTLNRYMHEKCNPMPIIEVEWDEINNTNFNHSYKIKDKYVIHLNLYPFICFERFWEEVGVSQKDSINLPSYILAFVFYHEAFHILSGHCSIPQNVADQMDALDKKQMEYMCDLLAARIMVADYEVLFRNKFYREDVCCSYIQFYASFLTAIYTYFYLHECDELDLMKESINSEDYKTFTSNKRDHPFVTFRCYYIMQVIEQQVFETCKELKFDESFFLNHIYTSFDEQLQAYGMGGDYFKVDPTRRRNSKEIVRIKEVDFDKIVSLCDVIFLNDLNT